MNLGWLLLVAGLGLTETSCCLFERFMEVVKHEVRPAIYMEKQLGWAGKLGGTESQGFSRVGQTPWLMESQIWHQFASSVGVEFRKGAKASAFLDPRHFSSFL